MDQDGQGRVMLLVPGQRLAGDIAAGGGEDVEAEGGQAGGAEPGDLFQGAGGATAGQDGGPPVARQRGGVAVGRQGGGVVRGAEDQGGAQSGTPERGGDVGAAGAVVGYAADARGHGRAPSSGCASYGPWGPGRAACRTRPGRPGCNSRPAPMALMTAAVNSVVDAEPPRSRVAVPAAIVSASPLDDLRDGVELLFAVLGGEPPEEHRAGEDHRHGAGDVLPGDVGGGAVRRPGHGGGGGGVDGQGGAQRTGNLAGQVEGDACDALGGLAGDDARHDRGVRGGHELAGAREGVAVGV
ncbi:Hypothetical Protein sle_17200 [Streptomyces leeuwenhoekii]|uniref:Uncharacterized protein n=1 Tax=Streptomyces leeuwenhoekii TaxID=1437453 RepID=A0A0F7VUK1_STRLW|nr:Hypothetical Protein sle_17200 [Streptomyces leeuwenhoekii]